MKVVIYSINLHASHGAPLAMMRHKQTHECALKTFTADDVPILQQTAPCAAVDICSVQLATQGFRACSPWLLTDYDMAIFVDPHIQIINENFVANMVLSWAQFRWDLCLCDAGKTVADELTATRHMYLPSTLNMIQDRLLHTARAYSSGWLAMKLPLNDGLSTAITDLMQFLGANPMSYCSDRLLWPHVVGRSKALRFKVHTTPSTFEQLNLKGLPVPDGLIEPLVPKKQRVVILVLAHSQDTFEHAKKKFAPYWWAKPLLLPQLSTNNPLFENKVYVDYDSLLRSHVETAACEGAYVGLMTYKGFDKVDVHLVHDAIQRQLYANFDMLHFACGIYTVAASPYARGHPHLHQIWHDVIEEYAGPADKAKESYFNFWCARRNVFEAYCAFLRDTLVPKLMAHPLVMTDAKYVGTLSSQALLDLCGVPWYPHAPFVLERFARPYLKHKGLTVGALRGGHGAV